MEQNRQLVDDETYIRLNKKIEFVKAKETQFCESLTRTFYSESMRSICLEEWIVAMDDLNSFLKNILLFDSLRGADYFEKKNNLNKLFILENQAKVLSDISSIQLNYNNFGDFTLRTPLIPSIRLQGKEEKKQAVHTKQSVVFDLIEFIRKYGYIYASEKNITIIIARNIPENSKYVKAYHDNDNMNTRCICNAICEAMGISDNYKYVSFYYLSRSTKEKIGYMDFIVCPQKKLANYLTFCEGNEEIIVPPKNVQSPWFPKNIPKDTQQNLLLITEKQNIIGEYP